MDVITRKEWGARRPRATTPLPPDDVGCLVVHYSAADADEQANHANCAARVRGIQNYHMDHNGWNDIAYNWLVCKHGLIFRGRGWRVMSAATLGANSFTVAVCFLGNDTPNRDDVTAAGRDAILTVWEFVQRNAENVQGVRGHRDFSSTECPGDQLYRYAHSLNL